MRLLRLPAFVKRLLVGRNLLLVGDQSLMAFGSVAILLFAARAFESRELALFSLAQLFITTLQGIVRAGLLNPALASQRSHGEGSIPFRWLLALVPIIIFFLFLATFVTSTTIESISQGRWSMAVAAVGASVIVQDLARYRLFSRKHFPRVLAADVAWLLTLISMAIYFEIVGSVSPFEVMIAWGSGSLVSLLIMSISTGVSKSGVTRQITLRQMWPLGKWSGLDAIMSASATLAPMIVTTFALGYESAGTYRVLQSALGPLNILHTSVSLSFGLDAWALNNRSALVELRAKVMRSTAALVGFAVLYIAFAEVVVLTISGLHGGELVRIAVIVGVAGVLGAATTAASAASLALGLQRFGALIRVFTVILSLSISLMFVSGLWLPWNDPIGTASLLTVIIGLTGWWLTFSSGLKLEIRESVEMSSRQFSLPDPRDETST